MKESVKAQIKRAPASPGVYIFKNKNNVYLYVGKALRLKDRLRSYTNPKSDKRPSVALMVPQIEQVEWLIASSEKEALILENNLIKTYRPKYNIMYRDDKSYLSVKITRHRFPRMYKTRKIVQDGSTYFGPFSSVASINQTMKLLQKIFQIRDCTDYFFKTRIRPCLRHQIDLCSAPCVKKITQDEYMEQVLQTTKFMKGQYREILDQLKAKMIRASENMQYESAAHYRDQVVAIEETLLPQRAENREKNLVFLDAVGVTGDEQATLIKLIKVRAGKLVDADEYYLDEPVTYQSEIVRSFLQQYYLEDITKQDIPREIVLPEGFEDMKSMQELLSDKVERKVSFVLPQRGKKKKYLELAQQNAQTIFLEKKRQSEKTYKTLQQLQNKLNLPHLPKRIEGYDISNFQGAQSFGSQVVFVDGEKDSGQYRIYSIKTVTGPDDFASLKEVLSRRLQRLTDENRPDLLLIDGGKGQLKQAVDVLQEVKLQIPVISIAKEKILKTSSGVRYAPERIFLPGQKNSIVFPVSSPLLQLLQRVRDEAHRFGLKYHRSKRSKQTFGSVLKNIKGVGQKRQKEILKHFGSIESIARATQEELLQVKSMNVETAKALIDFFQTWQADQE